MSPITYECCEASGKMRVEVCGSSFTWAAFSCSGEDADGNKVTSHVSLDAISIETLIAQLNAILRICRSDQTP